MIVSYFANKLASRTNIPAVLLLIVLGIGINMGMEMLGYSLGNLFPVLEVIGIVGLIMIVLEAALELKLTREKWPIIWKSLLVALIALVISTFVCAMAINFFIINDPLISLIYAVPLAIMSSAIIIPSVGNLRPEKQEFMVYESTFSDILGIMFFYFLVDNAGGHDSAGTIVFEVIGNILLTIVLSVAISYALIWVFQQLTGNAKLFLLIATLILLYGVGKLAHLSSLVIILIFGLILNNSKLFFRGFLKKLLKEDALPGVIHDLHLVTAETAFVVRTFFFVIFGMTIVLGSLLDPMVALISFIIVVGLYLVRFLVLKLFFRNTSIFPELYIAPRGLITILLFFAIGEPIQVEAFDSGILLYAIIITSLVMTWALIKDGRMQAAELEAADEAAYNSADAEDWSATRSAEADPANEQDTADEGNLDNQKSTDPEGESPELKE